MLVVSEVGGGEEGEGGRGGVVAPAGEAEIGNQK